MANTLSDLQLKKVSPEAKPISDGVTKGLRFEPGKAMGQGKWIFRYVSPLSGKRRDMGLGTFPQTSLKDARTRALEARRVVDNGGDPIDAREASKAAARARADAMTFEVAARQLYGSLSPGWKNDKHAKQWITTLEAHVFEKLGKRKVAELGPPDFASVLEPIWLTTPETASRVKQRCHNVMKWCWAQGLVNSNPLEVVDHLLAKQPAKRERVRHHPSMPWRDVPAFVQGTLWQRSSNVTRALLEFVILTAARSGEARHMTWDEVDLQNSTWIVPANRMKAKVLHRVPLSKRAVQLLEAQRAQYPASDLVFPAARGGVLSDMVLTKFLRDQKAHGGEAGSIATAHGFRSSFRDWASESGYPRDLAERALAHTIQNQAEAAYHRTDLLEPRRKMMETWAMFVCGEGLSGVVVQFTKASTHV